MMAAERDIGKFMDFLAKEIERKVQFLESLEKLMGERYMKVLLDLISLSGHSYVLLWITYHYNPIK